MTIEQAKALYEELRDKYEARLAECAALYDSEIYLESDDFEKVDSIEKGGYISLEINIFTDNIAKDDGICFCASAIVSGERVDDDDILNDKKAFEHEICEFIDRLSFADDVDALIREETEKTAAEIEESMREFESKMKMSTTAVVIAVAVCAVCAAVALIMHFIA